MTKVREKLKKEGLLVSIDGDRARVSNMIVFRVVGDRDSSDELQFRSVNPEAARGLATRLSHANSAYSTKRGRD